jgi:uncharacterized protein YjbI with pentapeptide repeats
VNQEQKPRKRSFIREVVPGWRPTREQRLWAVRMVIVIVVVLGVLVLIGLPFGITLWEWVKLLIVPAVIAGGGIWFNRQQREREIDIADQRAQDEALQAYLAQMGQLLLDKDRPLRKSKEGDEARTFAQAQTLTVLGRLDGDRKGSVMQFLYESGLIMFGTQPGMVDLKGADLSGANLGLIRLSEANLSDTNLIGANLKRADLSEANLYRTDLSGVNLEHADLHMAHLIGANLVGANLVGANLYSAELRLATVSEGRLLLADLREANLGGAKLHMADLHMASLSDANLHSADLRRADLSYANLDRANLEGANLEGANVTGANLTSANVTDEQFDKTVLAAGSRVTMPDGQEYRFEPKDKEVDREVGKNSDPS